MHLLLLDPFSTKHKRRQVVRIEFEQARVLSPKLYRFLSLTVQEKLEAESSLWPAEFQSKLSPVLSTEAFGEELSEIFWIKYLDTNEEDSDPLVLFFGQKTSQNILRQHKWPTVFQRNYVPMQTQSQTMKNRY